MNPVSQDKHVRLTGYATHVCRCAQCRVDALEKRVNQLEKKVRENMHPKMRRL